ncbi:hypothetical protein F4809DRAFT_639371 [Biscogniauxia mediterranea]|nr:hypothetical protein F4809DRAFT_639371 [Biscogniauxia mediterranea]
MSSTTPTSPPPSPSTPTILLLSSDNIPFRLPPSAASHALLLRSLLSSPSLAPSLSSGTPLPLPLPGSVLGPLVSWCSHQEASSTSPLSPPPPLPSPPPSLSPLSPSPSTSPTPSSPTPFDQTLIATADTTGGVGAVYALARGAAYLGVRPLLEAACAAVAAGIRGRGTAEMRGLLGIEEGGGFGPGEEERARACGCENLLDAGSAYRHVQE